MKVWEKKDWKLASSGGGSKGYTVSCKETGEYGVAKPEQQYLYQDVLASSLAAAVDLPVPKTQLGLCEGKTIAVSHAWGTVSMDLAKMRRDHPEDFNSAGMTDARKKASGLLALNAWIANNSDHKDDHVVSRPGSKPDTYELAAVDFQFCFQDGNMKAAIQIVGPPSLIDRGCHETAILEKTISRIESLSIENITSFVDVLPESVLPGPDKKRIVPQLIDRKAKLRAAFKAAGWLPDPPESMDAKSANN